MEGVHVVHDRVIFRRDKRAERVVWRSIASWCVALEIRGIQVVKFPGSGLSSVSFVV